MAAGTRLVSPSLKTVMRVLVTVVTSAALVIPGVMLSLPWFRGESAVDQFQPARLMVVLRYEDQPWPWHAVKLTTRHEVKLESDGSGVETIGIYRDDIDWEKHLLSAEVFVDLGSWATNPWTCNLTQAALSLTGYFHSSRIGSLVSEVVPRQLLFRQDADEERFGLFQDYQLFTETDDIRSTELDWTAFSEQALLPAPEQDFGFSDGVTCRRTGVIAPDLGQGERLYQPTEVGATALDEQVVTPRSYESLNYPGVWDQKPVRALAGNGAHLPTDSYLAQGEYHGGTRSVGTLWNAILFVDPRAQSEIQRYAWIGGLLLGAWVGAIVPVGALFGRSIIRVNVHEQNSVTPRIKPHRVRPGRTPRRSRN